uniref:Uncharacterized protein n=1 Tax=Crocodylus porosus TaxID=8502 RepID=A0A7M4E200_CROPO
IFLRAGGKKGILPISSWHLPPSAPPGNTATGACRSLPPPLPCCRHRHLWAVTVPPPGSEGTSHS